MRRTQRFEFAVGTEDVIHRKCRPQIINSVVKIADFGVCKHLTVELTGDIIWSLNAAVDMQSENRW